jgi:cellulose biosynthesis protein BcsQ
MPLVAVVNTKGGQGKTTWACALAAFLDAELLDANPENGDAEAWARLAGHPCRFIYPDHLEELEAAAKGKTWTVVDCPPWDGRETRAALALSRAALVPVASGYQDLRGLARVIKLVREAKGQANPKLRAMIIGNGRRAVAFTPTWEEALRSYDRPKEGCYYLGCVPQRQAIVDAFGAGLPAFKAGQPAAQEVRDVLSKVVELLKSN